MTELEPLITTLDLTSTQFQCFTPECRRVGMDSFDIEAGTVVVVDGCASIGNGDRDEKAWAGFDGRVVHYGII